MSSFALRLINHTLWLHNSYRHWKHFVVSLGVPFIIQKGLEHNSEIYSLVPLRAAAVRAAGLSVPCIGEKKSPQKSLPFIYWHPVDLCFILSPLHPSFLKAQEGFSIDLAIVLPGTPSYTEAQSGFGAGSFRVKDCLVYVQIAQEGRRSCS